MQKQQTLIQPQAPIPLSALSQPGVIQAGRLRQALRTLKGQFIALATCIAILAVVQALMISMTYARAAGDLDTINTGSIPSVNAAQAMAQYIEDIDAKSADYLATASLTQLAPCSIVGTDRNPGQQTVHDCDNLNIDAELVLANRELFNAAHNVTYPGERTAIERITAGYEEYSSDIALMRHEYDLAVSKTNPQDPHLQKARQAYLAANDVLQQRITLQPTTSASGQFVFNEPTVPACTVRGTPEPGTTWALGSIEDNVGCLDEINKTYLDNAYNDTISFLGGAVDAAVFFSVVFCALLFVTTLRMMAATHRLVNPGLTLALIVSIVFCSNVVGLFAGMAGRHGDFGQLVKDDYDSIYFAAQLKRYGTEANADESRWLIALAFNDQAAADHWQQDWQTNTAQVLSLIDRAQTNRTYPEEDQPLVDLHASWQRYFDIDLQIRMKATDTTNPARIRDAELLSTGDSNHAFDGFSKAVDGLSQANQSHYDTTYASTRDALTLYITLSALLFPLLGLVAIGGIVMRLKDF